MALAATPDGRDDIEHALNEGVGTEEQDQDGERDAWHDQRQGPEYDRGDSAQSDSPPVPCERVGLHVDTSPRFQTTGTFATALPIS